MTNETRQESNPEKIEISDKGQANNSPPSVANNMELINGFNDILGNHIERLLDTRLGIEELELNIFSISCIVLLATRETEIETFPAQPPPRYTVASITKELAEMSIEPDSEVKKVIDDMIHKNYTKITDERIFSNKPMSSMAQLFDRIFPRMPGLNLVAYLGQMMDEVMAGRKSQAEASRQFNQMLEIQGVSINEQATSRTAKKKFSYLRVEDDSPEKRARRPVALAGKPANIFSQLKTGMVIKTPVSVNEGILHPVQERTGEIYESLRPNETFTGNIPTDQSDSQETSDSLEDTGFREETQESEERDKTIEIQDRISDSFEPADDREIEDRILEFEEQLGLKCPLCRTGGIKTSETAKGKAYYHCSNTECNFISWGKPYYFECPKCDSNFLIEITDSNGKSFLKCPKATCTHWQKFPWDESDQPPGYSGSIAASDEVIKKPVRKVRRRRVVRRKKSA